MLETSRDLEEGSLQMRVGNGARISTTTVGTVQLSFVNNKYLWLDNVYFILDFKRNLLSVSRLYEQFIFVSFNIDSVSISKNGINICLNFFDDGLYFVKSYSTKCYKPKCSNLLNQP